MSDFLKSDNAMPADGMRLFKLWTIFAVACAFLIKNKVVSVVPVNSFAKFEMGSDELKSINRDVSPKIVGGQDVKDRREFAYQISFRFFGRHICGGTIVGQKHILTAAHCLVDFLSKKPIEAGYIEIVAGDLLLSSPANTTVVKKVKEVIPHPKYDPDRFSYDVGLLKLRDPFDWTDYVQSIPMANTFTPDETICLISGWGNMKEGGVASDTLKYASIPIVNFDVCNKNYRYLKNGMICAGYTSGGIDACQGDSGGPLVCSDKLTGIVSFGKGCGVPGYPGVYTDVNYYRSWITSAINGANPSFKTKKKLQYFTAITLLASVLHKFS